MIHRLKQAPVTQETRRVYTQLVKEENEKFIPLIRPRFQSQFGGLWTDLTTPRAFSRWSRQLVLHYSQGSYRFSALRRRLNYLLKMSVMIFLFTQRGKVKKVLACWRGTFDGLVRQLR